MEPGSTLDHTVDISQFGFTVEPQVWFQSFDTMSRVTIKSISATSIWLHFYNDLSWSENVRGWLKLTNYV